MNPEERFAWAAMVGGLSMVPLLVPGSVLDGLDDASYWALRAYVVLVPLLAVLRWLARPVAERWTLAVFLAAMPQVYVSNALRTGAPTGWLVAESAALVVFTVVAWVGATRRPLLLAAGIAAHGLFWDAWHYPVPSGRRAIARRYALGGPATWAASWLLPGSGVSSAPWTKSPTTLRCRTAR